MDKHIPILKRLLQHLDLGQYGQNTEGGHLQEAAQWALNDATFLLHKYEITALRPVLETLKGGTSIHYIKPKKLSTDLAMPLDAPPENLQSYLSQFKQALKEAKDEQLLSTLEVWASSIATSSKFNDLSLFDFIRATVGIAACLETGTKKLRLAGGSVSGIQTYLYDIISKNAAKLLKGRSFYLQLLTDSLLDELLHDFDLTPCHIVYSSGGGFYVFMPDTEGVVERFTQFKQAISEKVYQRHKTNLFVEFALTESFNADEPINTLWDNLFTSLNKQKTQRLTSTPKLLDDFFNPVELGGTRDKDPITNEEFNDEDNIASLLDGTRVLLSTKQQIELGRDLRNATYWVTSDTQIGTQVATLKDPLGKFHYLEKELPKGDLSGKRILTINETDSVFPFVFYGGNRFPVFQFDKKDDKGKTIHYKGEIMPYDALIDGEGFTRLGILRMDIDGLGAIFSEKEKIQSATYGLNWTRYIAVSRCLDNFFKGYLNVLQAPHQDSSLIIYSGGDDLFLVGRWDTILTLAETIYEKFKAWSCGNLNISGGVQLLPNKFPVMQGANMTDAAEKAAKNHKFETNTEGVEIFDKNAITLFGVPLNWETEYPKVKALQELIFDFIQQDKLTRSFIGKVNMHAEAQNAYLTKRVKTPKWLWVMAYDFARLSERTKDSKARDFINDMKDASVTDREKGSDKKIKSKYPFLTLLQLASRWAELRNRALQENNSEN
jgi:CRISPR-associated protein Csm1